MKKKSFKDMYLNEEFDEEYVDKVREKVISSRPENMTPKQKTSIQNTIKFGELGAINARTGRNDSPIRKENDRYRTKARQEWEKKLHPLENIPPTQPTPTQNQVNTTNPAIQNGPNIKQLAGKGAVLAGTTAAVLYAKHLYKKRKEAKRKAEEAKLRNKSNVQESNLNYFVYNNLINEDF